MTGIWFIDDLERLNSERAAVAELERSSGWLSGTRWFLLDADLALDATIVVGDRPHAVRLIYPELFPAVPPIVRPQQKDEHWSGHQYGDGTLCLEWGPDTWSPSVTGAMMLESAFRLFSLEDPAGSRGGLPAPSRHQLTLGQEARFARRRLLAGNDLVAQLATIGIGEIWVAEVAVFFRSHSTLAVVRSMRRGEAEIWENSELPRPFQPDEDPAIEGEAIAVCLQRLEPAGAPFRKLDELNALLVESGYSELDPTTNQSVLAIDVGGNLRFFRRIEGAGDVVQEFTTIRTEPA